MEERFAHDFGEVRVHTDAKATDSARSLNAQASTVGSDIVFRGDKYEPESSEGRRVLAHELTHVIQQKSGPVDGTPGPGGVSVSDPSDRFEREAGANAERVVSVPGEPPPSAAPSILSSSSVQREAGSDEVEEDETKPAQTGPAQRQAEPEEEEGG
jgi:hypothetical protein